MKDYTNIMNKASLFAGVNEDDLGTMLDCLGAKKKPYKKGEYIFNQGDVVSYVGMVLEGSVLITKEDYWGNRTILSEIQRGNIFGEAFACAEDGDITVNATAVEDSVIMILDVNRILTVCPQGCTFHTSLIKNLVTVLAQKNINLSEKIEHISQRKLRDKILSYLSGCESKSGSATFVIPFNRQELADYLSVDRSALSFELSKLSREGILKYEKNKFELL